MSLQGTMNTAPKITQQWIGMGSAISDCTENFVARILNANFFATFLVEVNFIKLCVLISK